VTFSCAAAKAAGNVAAMMNKDARDSMMWDQ
jgi:hypothetical protein